MDWRETFGEGDCAAGSAEGRIEGLFDAYWLGCYWRGQQQGGVFFEC
uniref:Uncharacterized protein n=1 Tax=Rhizophora mucronata TaxID=61149 RepID=A0A2P2PR82_RHIMU